MTLLLSLILLAQTEGGESKEECKKAVDAYHEAMKGAAEAAKIVAIDALAKHHCLPAVAAIAPQLQAPEDQVRLAAIRALGGMDHQEAVEALVAVLPSWESAKNPTFDALLKAIQTLDWESGAEPLNGLLTKFHEKGMIDEMKPIIQALGSIGSATSVQPLLTLLEHAENESSAARVKGARSTANPKLKALEGPIRSALQSITGGNEPNYKGWHSWWPQNRERLMESATLVYHCKMTGKRFEQKAGEAMACPYHDKPDKDGQLVKTRLKPRA
jgi:HEAT repeat protein